MVKGAVRVEREFKFRMGLAVRHYRACAPRIISAHQPQAGFVGGDRPYFDPDRHWLKHQTSQSP